MHEDTHVSQWFYAEGNRERRGPLSAENIVELFRSGRIVGDTLVWREGAGDWQPLRNFAAELGLDEAVAPSSGPAAPPLPPPVQYLPPAAAAMPAPVAKPGLSGCAIIGIVVAVVGVVLVAIAGILAAIAVPAYAEYLQRSKTAIAYGQLLPLQAEVAAFAQAHGRCPVNGDDGFGEPEALATGEVASVRVGRFGNGHCGIEARLHVPGRDALDGKAIWLDYDSDTGTWQCSSDVADKFLPTGCRG